MEKITYKKLEEVNFLFQNVFLRQHDIKNPTTNKFTWALFKLSEELKINIEIFNKKRSEIFIKYASVDANDNIQYEDLEKGICKFTKEKSRERDAEFEILLSQEIDFQGYIYQNNNYIKENYGFLIPKFNKLLFDISDEDFSEPENDIVEESSTVSE